MNPTLSRPHAVVTPRCPKCTDVMVEAQREPRVRSETVGRVATPSAPRFSLPVWRCPTCGIDRPRLDAPQPSASASGASLPESETGLYWSSRGHVLCREHAAAIGREEWITEGWAAAPPSRSRLSRVRLQCERCSPDQTAAVHLPQANGFRVPHP